MDLFESSQGTRHDNRAMIRIFEKCRFVKEAHHRHARPDGKGKFYDAVGYVIKADRILYKKTLFFISLSVID